jgi:hypothetical protein
MSLPTPLTTRYESVEVSSASPFGGKSQAGKEIKRRAAQGWRYTGSQQVSRNRFVLHFEYVGVNQTRRKGWGKGTRIVLAIVFLAIIAGATFAPRIVNDYQEIFATRAAESPATAIPSVNPTAIEVTDYETRVSNSIFLLAGGRNVGSIRVADGRAEGGERVAIIGYASTESTDGGRIDEIIDLFRAVGASIRADTLDIDSVVLVAGNSRGEVTSTMAASKADVLALQNGSMSQAQFLERLTSTDF